MNEIKLVLGHVNTDLFNCNALIIVEGPTEYETMPLLAANLGIDIVNEGIYGCSHKDYQYRITCLAPANCPSASPSEPHLVIKLPLHFIDCLRQSN
jgi:hypothetical protein